MVKQDLISYGNVNARSTFFTKFLFFFSFIFSGRIQNSYISFMLFRFFFKPLAVLQQLKTVSLKCYPAMLRNISNKIINHVSAFSCNPAMLWQNYFNPSTPLNLDHSFVWYCCKIIMMYDATWYYNTLPECDVHALCIQNHCATNNKIWINSWKVRSKNLYCADTKKKSDAIKTVKKRKNFSAAWLTHQKACDSTRHGRM